MTMPGVKCETVSNPTGDTDISAGDVAELCVEHQMKA